MAQSVMPEIRPSQERSALSCATRQASGAGTQLTITRQTAKDLARAPLQSRVTDNLQRLLEVISSKARRPGDSVEFIAERDFTWIDCLIYGEFYKLTLKGWERARPLAPPGDIPGVCFVAMSFDQTLDDAYHRGIKPAITDADCTGGRVDEVLHNDEITDWFQFMVAGFTLHRNGVYFEAGFASGLGRQVISCCREDNKDDLHFDTRNRFHIVWSTPQDLRTKLHHHIRATIIRI